MQYSFVPANEKGRLATLQEVIQSAAQKGREILPITGNCMEGVDIMDGGRVALDFTHYPRPGRRENGKYIDGDPCICYATCGSKVRPGRHRSCRP